MASLDGDGLLASSASNIPLAAVGGISGLPKTPLQQVGACTGTVRCR